ncbi:MAG: sn-glycerol-3-phosphate ABC transporter ATP-binding protein UgpC [Burkholderiales bacterium]|nr:sn-glycerol-3-phosphate ABC transporter ATP-binding protein UgpC [Burkholderiales bacterium]
MSSPPLIELRGLRKSFGSTPVLHGIDLQVQDGEFVVFVGPSGCGKSTLLRCIAGLETISEGQLLIAGQDCTHAHPSQRGLAMVFQSYALYPHMTVAQNLSFGMRMRGVDKATREAKLARAIQTLKLEPYLARKPGELSGGQCQRVAIGRALVQEPKLFLFDEPLSNLDAELRVHLRVELAALHRELGRGMVYVTHDQVEAMTLADRIVVLRGGRIEQVGAPLELYHQPANAFVAGFIGSPAINFLDVRCRGGEPRLAQLPGGPAWPIQHPATEGQALRLGVRPEHWQWLSADAPDALPATVSLVERLGASSYAYLDSRWGRLCVQGPADLAVQVGEAVGLKPTQAPLLFDAESGRRL